MKKFATLVIAFAVTSAMLSTPARAASKPRVTVKVSASSVVSGTSVKVSGSVASGVKGQAITLQRWSGRSWTYLRSTRLPANRRFSFAATTHVGTQQFRIRLTKKGKSKAATSAKVAVRGTLSVTPSPAMIDERVTVSGVFPTRFARNVELHVYRNSRWVRERTARANTAGLVRIESRAVDRTKTVRLVAPKVVVKKKSYAAVTSPSITISTVPQTATLTIPPTAVENDVATASASFGPVRAGRVTRLQRKAGDSWSTVASSTQNKQGVSLFSVPTTVTGETVYRAIAEPFLSAPTVVSGEKSMEITRAYVPPRPLTSDLVDYGERLGYPTAVSADGRFVVFSSASRFLSTFNDTNYASQIYLWDRDTGSKKMISRNAAGLPGSADSTRPSISSDGRYVVYASTAKDLVASDGNRATADVFLFDRISGQTTIVTRDVEDGPANGPSASPMISGDGTTVVFSSTATDLVHADPAPDGQHVYAWNHETGVTTAITNSGGGGYAPQVSRDGAVVAFLTYASRVIDGRSRGGRDIVIWRAADDSHTSLDAFTLADGYATDYDLADSGSTLAVASPSADFVSDDDNGKSDVFVIDTLTGVKRLISRNLAGRPANGRTMSPSISSNGNNVVFSSSATDLTSGIETSNNIYMWDAASDQIDIISSGAAGIGGNSMSNTPVISGDASTVTYSSHATDLLLRANELGVIHLYMWQRPEPATPR